MHKAGDLEKPAVADHGLNIQDRWGKNLPGNQMADFGTASAD